MIKTKGFEEIMQQGFFAGVYIKKVAGKKY